MEESLQHALVEEHVAHGFRDDQVHLLGQVNLFDFTGQHVDVLRQCVELDQCLLSNDVNDEETGNSLSFESRGNRFHYHYQGLHRAQVGLSREKMLMSAAQHEILPGY